MLKLLLPKQLLKYIHNTILDNYSLASYVVRCVNYIAVHKIPISELYSTPLYKEINTNNQGNIETNDRPQEPNKRGKDINNNTM